MNHKGIVSKSNFDKFKYWSRKLISYEYRLKHALPAIRKAFKLGKEVDDDTAYEIFVKDFSESFIDYLMERMLEGEIIKLPARNVKIGIFMVSDKDLKKCDMPEKIRRLTIRDGMMPTLIIVKSMELFMKIPAFPYAWLHPHILKRAIKKVNNGYRYPDLKEYLKWQKDLYHAHRARRQTLVTTKSTQPSLQT